MRAFKNILNVFGQQNKIKDYSLKIRKNKKQEHKNVTKPLKENKQKRFHECYRNLSEDENIKKRNYANTKVKTCHIQKEKEKEKLLLQMKKIAKSFN